MSPSSTAKQSNDNVVNIKRHPEFYFDNTLIAILIEDTLFNVHKYQLMKSTTFSDMFAIAEASQDASKTQEGLSPECPIVMKGVSASDFECLMRVLYASHFSSHQPEPAASLIIPAFRLANMWNFAELCAYLMPLAEKVLSDVDKIVFARESKVIDWLVPAHVRICLRKDKINSEEARKLGIDSLLFISRFREDQAKKLVTTFRCAGCNLTSCGNCGGNYVPSTTGKPSESQVKRDVQKWLDSNCILLDSE
ncbi:The BTB (BR-C, ttk and bab)/POZ (Pox virus and Zinc finger) domain [Ceratobasidium sp. AG-Ba]|nr:The BTB (BR-C, ttk and bab)/POZ (Pox virus and Zinc finger) domain [Ceratobasidium sp. AG-Ba]QRW07316.1 The BTB (BR-C, ttk and bab)/POZ (Pox virus and Zinc finger) domain [Ceratobasidium sp. AG-Ba]